MAPLSGLILWVSVSTETPRVRSPVQPLQRVRVRCLLRLQVCCMWSPLLLELAVVAWVAEWDGVSFVASLETRERTCAWSGGSETAAG